MAGVASFVRIVCAATGSTGAPARGANFYASQKVLHMWNDSLRFNV